MNRILKPLSIVVLVGGLLIFSNCSSKHEEGKESNEHHVENSVFPVTNPLRADTVIQKSYVCQLRSIQHIELRSLDEGYLQNVYVDEGQYVNKGQLLFQLRPTVYKAEVNKRHAEVKHAEIEYRNTKSLADKDIVSPSELALAQAELDKAKAELELANAHLSFTQIRAPFSGIIGRFNEVRLGSLLDQGELLTTLSDNSRIWAYFNVPEAEYLDYMSSREKAKGDLVQLQLANQDIFEEFGMIETIEADFNNATGNIAFRANFPNPKRLLRHGETGNILINNYLNNVLLIPQKTTFEVLDKKFVFVIDKHGKVRTREITVGNELQHLFEVTSGLKQTDRILLDGLRKVKDGIKIKTEFKKPADVYAHLELYAE